MVLKIILFSSLVMSVSIAQSGWTSSHESSLDQLNGKDKRAFNEAIKSCELYKNRKLNKFEFTPQEANVFFGTMGDVNYAAEKVLSDGWQAGSRVFRQTGGTGMYLHELLNSYGFMLAMKKCFNGDDSRENRYVAELILIDAAVKAVYMGGTYLTLKFLLARRWGLALLTSLVVTPISGDSPKPQEVGFIEKMEDDLAQIKRQVEQFTKKPNVLP